MMIRLDDPIFLAAKALYAARYWPGYAPGEYTNRKWDEADPSLRDACVKDVLIVLDAAKLSKSFAAIERVMNMVFSKDPDDLKQGVILLVEGRIPRHTVAAIFDSAERAAYLGADVLLEAIRTAESRKG